MFRNYLYITIFSLLLFSCKRETVAAASSDSDNEVVEEIIPMEPRNVLVNEFVAEVVSAEENSLVKEKTIGDFSFTLSYEPWESLIIKDNSITISKEEFEKDLQGRSKMLYFTLKINNTKFTHKELLLFNLSSQEEYTDRLNYYSFKIQNDLKLTIGNEEIPCGMAHFERTFGLSPGLTISLAFPISESISKQITEKKLKESLRFSFDEKVFNNGMIQFSFHPNNINSVPKPVIE